MKTNTTVKTCTVDDKLEYFSSTDTALMWALTELIATLEDDLYLHRWEYTRDDYTDFDRETMASKIHDITLLRDSNLPPRETTPLTNALCEGRR
jgi:hypothetical protein